MTRKYGRSTATVFDGLTHRLARRGRLLQAMTAATTCTIGLLGIGVASADATPTPVAAYYVDGGSVAAVENQVAEAACNFEKARGTNSALAGDRVLLFDFGNANFSGGSWGTNDFNQNGLFLKNSDILTALELASNEVHACATEGQTIITYGNNNSDAFNSLSATNATDAGYYQENVANELSGYEEDDSRVDQGAADAADIEPGFGTPPNAIDMVNGADSFGSSSDPNEHEDKPYMYLDYGSADGCSTGCSKNWTPAQVAYVSWGASVAQSLPEIYVSGQTPDWVKVQQSNQSGTAYQFYGVTGTPGEPYTPQQGWNALSSAEPMRVGNELISIASL